MTQLLRSLKKCDILYQSSVYHQSVRWATKPRWIPTAKTKIFRVPRRPVIPPEETAELKKLYFHYKTEMKSVKKLFNEIHRANETSEEVLQKLEQEKEDDWRRCMELNDKWNQEIAIERTKKDAELLEEKLEYARQKKKLLDEKEEQRLQKLEEMIKKEKEASKYYITENNIDEVIDKILTSPPHSFNFAIDLEGRKYSGYNSTPDITSESENQLGKEQEKFVSS